VEPRIAATHQDDAPAGGGRKAASITTDETRKDVLTDTPPSQPDTKNCIQVGRDTYAVTSQPGTSYTFNPGIDTRTFQEQRPQPVTNPVCDDYDSIVVIDSSESPNNLVGRETIALMPIEKYAATTPHIDTSKKYKKPPSGSHKKQKNTRSKHHRLP